MDGKGDQAGGIPARFDVPRAGTRWGTLAILAIVAAALLGSVFLIYDTIESERMQRTQSGNTVQILAELANINRAVLNAETGQRGYLITLDRRYLGPYFSGREQYGPALTRLQDLLADDATARQRELLERIEMLANSKFAEMKESVALLEDGDLIEARRRTLTDEGQEVMERLRASVREMEQIEQILLTDTTAQTAHAEARVVPLLGGLLALIVVTLWLGLRLSVRAARAETEAAQSANLAEARDRADLLARELNHRVKNLFAVILAIVRMSAKDAPEAKPVVDRIAERIHALLTAHEVTQGTLETPVASLQILIETTIRPYLSAERRVALDGPEVQLPAKQVTPLGLVLHELTTNAVKYGCWSTGGLLSVTWAPSADGLAIDWREDCPGDAVEPERQGFGSLLMTSAARQLRGTIDRKFTRDGVQVAIRIPLED